MKGLGLNRWDESIDFEFSSPPMPPLGVVSDGIIGFVAEPIGKRSVLPLLFG